MHDHVRTDLSFVLLRLFYHRHRLSVSRGTVTTTTAAYERLPTSNKHENEGR